MSYVGTHEPEKTKKCVLGQIYVSPPERNLTVAVVPRRLLLLSSRGMDNGGHWQLRQWDASFVDEDNDGGGACIVKDKWWDGRANPLIGGGSSDSRRHCPPPHLFPLLLSFQCYPCCCRRQHHCWHCCVNVVVFVAGRCSHQCRHCPCLCCRGCQCCCHSPCHCCIDNIIALNAAIAVANAIAFAAAIAAVLDLAAAVTAVLVVAITATTITTTTAAPLPLSLLSPLLQPPPMSPCLQPSRWWLVVVSSVAPHLLHHPPSKFVSPRSRAIFDTLATGPLSPFANHGQPLSCHSCPNHQLLLFVPLIVGCCILCPPSSLLATLPSWKHYQFPHSWTYPFGGKPPKAQQSSLWMTNPQTVEELKSSCNRAWQHPHATNNLLEVWQNSAVFGSRPIGGAIEALLTQVVVYGWWLLCPRK